MNTILRTAAALSATFTILGSADAGPNDAAEPATSTASSVVVKAEKAIERGAKAAARGVEHGVKAAASGVERGAKAAASGVERGAKAAAGGVERGAKATGNAANIVARKVGVSPASSATTGGNKSTPNPSVKARPNGVPPSAPPHVER